MDYHIDYRQVFTAFLVNSILIIGGSLALWVPYAKSKWKEQPNKEASTELTATESFVLVLGDTHLVSAFAIIIASLSKLSKEPQYPLYHLFISRSLAEMSLIGHNTGLYFVYSKFEKYHRSSLWLRVALTSCVTVFYLVWSGVSFYRFRQWNLNDWPSFTPLCFSYRLNKSPGDFTTWIIIDSAWTPLSYMWIFARSEKLLKRAAPIFDDVDNHIALTMKHVWTKYWKLSNLRPPDDTRPFPWASVSVVFKNILWSTVKTVYAVTLISVSMVCFPTTILDPFSSMLFTAWNAYDIVTTKLGNRKIVTDILQTTASPVTSNNPEMEMGFGQVFPVIMLLLWIIALLDAFGSRRITKGERWSEADPLLLASRKQTS